MNLESDKRLNIQLRLDFSSAPTGEARQAGGGDIESLSVANEPERPADTRRIMEEVCERKNLKEALRQVRSNKGSAGVDGMTVDKLGDYLKQHWPVIREQLLNRTYEPKPVRRVEIPKPDGGGMRKLGIPTVLDRFVQQAVMQVLQRQWNPTFSQYSYGFRPRRSAHHAVAQAQQYIAQGYGWVIDLDLEKFFDRVNHDKLMGQIAKRVGDKRLLKLIRAFLNAGVMENGLVSPSVEGTPQGGPLSPLLSNLVLDELDRELEHRGHRFVRYADDCNIYVRSERAGQRVMESTQKLKLKVNEAKSAVARPQERKFLGFSFTAGPCIKRTIAPKSLERFKQRIRDTTRRAKGVSIKTTMEELAKYMRGWRGYFGFCETPEVLIALTRWVRLRLRAALWRQWKTPGRRRAALIALGVSGELRNMAGSGRGPWHLARSKALSVGLSNAHFKSLGFLSLIEAR
ncbi:group II intron reverse transcriptase/maturase [Bradyrhizobium sp. 186]|uniref:group II intron reverse transcriptase/maturase n=1 Tax=Bradyrhizobium sp. 186 TaxID=2782654 RepID=UPI002001814B|nr:group II intron reverse transcriptase/maturase [Bradyrhizobium sp. 186]UPK32266.1 group II intron reverse transcriptase/maturase [Bradyrhizobium sp. 186]UPK39085.1 group II intron reverse transcriptase/maturase [Bradyrhizobium sp. 186]